jgi:hypothetical protein
VAALVLLSASEIRGTLGLESSSGLLCQSSLVAVCVLLEHYMEALVEDTRRSAIVALPLPRSSTLPSASPARATASAPVSEVEAGAAASEPSDIATTPSQEEVAVRRTEDALSDPISHQPPLKRARSTRKR